MIDRKVPVTGNGTLSRLALFGARLFLFLTTLTLLSILGILVCLALLTCLLAGIILFFLMAVALSGLLLVVKGYSALVIGYVRRETLATTSSRSRQRIRIWLVASAKRLLRWLIPLLLWQLWQWASEAGNQAPNSGAWFRFHLTG